ncbi:MAG: hypothetical protein E7212_15110 [Clostridium sartagoforme]|nr:hypothetical protein [Clostridium sartagoforme]
MFRINLLNRNVFYLLAYKVLIYWFNNRIFKGKNTNEINLTIVKVKHYGIYKQKNTKIQVEVINSSI